MSPLIQRVIANNPGPFTFTGTSTFIVGREDRGAGLAVIDPGPADEAHFAALMAAVDGRRVSHILVTHTHRDHSPLAHPFAKAVGAPILAARPPERATHASATLDEEEDERFQPDTILSGGETIAGDGWTIQAIFTPGHASNHMAFALIDEHALFCGDHVMGWSTTIVAPPDGNMSDYMASLDVVIAQDFRTLWPTHGPPVTEPAPFLEAYRAHRLDRETQIFMRVQGGDGEIAAIVPTLYAGVDERLWPAASLSVRAHLEKLVREGRVQINPDGRYVPG